MSQQSFGQSLAHITTPGTLYNTFTTAKSMLNSATATGASAGVVPLNAGFWQIGTVVTIEFLAGVSWASGNTMTFSIMQGSTAIATSSAMKVTTTGGTTEPLYGYVILTCRSVGNGTLATVSHGGLLMGRMVVPAGATAGANYTAGSGSASWSEAVPAVGTGFDSSISNVLDFQVAMGTSAAGNGFQIQQYNVFSRNTAGF